MSVATRNLITSGNYHENPSLQRGVVLKRFYSPRAVGTPLLEVHALCQVAYPSSYFCNTLPLLYIIEL